MGKVIGCDLGTTNSVIAYTDDNNLIQYIKDPSGSALIPSVVTYADTIYVGRDALEVEEDYPEHTIRSSKRFIGQNTVVHSKKNITAEMVAEDILRYLKTLTNNLLGEIQGIVITVPAYFNQNQRLKTKEAAISAGFNVLRIINEPTAAALAYGDESKLNELVLVYDLGGGTFDVTLLQLSSDDVYQVLATSGNVNLGGDDFDQVIMESFKKQLPQGVKFFKDFDVRLKKFSEEVKIQLNYKQKIKKTLKYCGTLNGKIYHHDFEYNEEQYLTEISHLLNKTKNHVLNALNDANKKISNLSKIILVGGSTKSKFVREFVKKQFNTKVYHEIDPDLTVAVGANRLAQSLNSQDSNGVLLIDVTPLSLGIETKGGILTKIIPRNTNIPVSAEQEFITAEDNQDFVNIKIYQGERPLAKDNAFLGEFVLSGFEKRPKGQTKIIIKCEIDASGLIIVSAFDKISGIQAHVELLPLTSDVINNVLDDLEIHKEDDEKIKLELELEDLRGRAKTLIVQKTLINKELNQSMMQMYESIKDNKLALSNFINDFENLILD